MYYIRNTLHGYPDTKALQLLKNIKAAMGSETVLLIDDMVVPDRYARWQATQIDIINDGHASGSRANGDAMTKAASRRWVADHEHLSVHLGKQGQCDRVRTCIGVRGSRTAFHGFLIHRIPEPALLLRSLAIRRCLLHSTSLLRRHAKSPTFLLLQLLPPLQKPSL